MRSFCFYFYDIYLTNGEEIKDDYALIKDKELYLFEYYNNNINTMQNEDTLFAKTKGNTGRDRWIYSLTKNKNNLNGALINEDITVEDFVKSVEYKYFVLLKNDYGGEYDKVQDEVKKYNVGTTLPVLIFMDQDKELFRLIGEKNYEEIMKAVGDVK